MFAQPSFLKNPEINHRHYLQLLGFLSSTYWEDTEMYVGKPLFRLPEFSINNATIDDLDIHEYLRLGNRLERFFSFIIKQSERYEMVAENIQIISNKVTLGELDFLIKDRKKNEIIHVELAGKLYLYSPNYTTELERWIGPNLKDTLQRKLIKLKDRQFPLLYQQDTIKILKSLGVNTDVISQKMCMKIRQFLPWKMHELPALAFRNNIKGYYVNSRDFQDDYFRGHQYFMPEKQDWIVAPEYCEVWMTYKKILKKIKNMHNQHQSPMIWLKKDNKTYETFFVTFW